MGVFRFTSAVGIAAQFLVKKDRQLLLYNQSLCRNTLSPVMRLTGFEMENLSPAHRISIASMFQRDEAQGRGQVQCGILSREEFIVA